MGSFNALEGKKIKKTSNLQVTTRTFAEDAEPYVYFDFNQYGMNSNLIMMLASGATWLSVCLMADHLVFERILYKFANHSAPAKPAMTSDEDVLAENKKIKNMEPVDLKAANLVLTGLSKSYSSNLAVNQLHLGVDNSECFGLLGVNGAGKTSTFKMVFQILNHLRSPSLSTFKCTFR